MENTVKQVGAQPEWAVRFWGKVDRTGGEDSCWLWTGCTVQGYGRLKIGGRQADAHRLAWELEHCAIPVGLVVRHSCDNRRCCNPAHLSLGTVQDNNKDRDDRGRTARGGRNGSAKLSDEDVIAMRASFAAGDATAASLARQYGLTASAVGYIIKGLTWRHLLP